MTGETQSTSSGVGRLTQKQETFCVKYFELGNATQAAVLAGYKPKNADVIASQNLQKLSIKERLQELRQKTEDASVMNVLERKQRLTEIAKARLTDFMELGQDGSWVNLGPETPLSGAIQEIHSRTEYDKDGASPTVYTSVKLYNPLQAIDLLNKMDKLYSEGAIVNIDNRKVEINVGIDYREKILSAVSRSVIEGGEGKDISNPQS
ncbi:MAG: terminase small subunit [Dehalococcoidia bacterium]|nr:terminase small subunit [Dehalococcoidia bacterium]